MELFKKPKWLKPEINEPIYWVHLVILAAVVLWVVNLFDIGQFTNIADFFARIIPVLKDSFTLNDMLSIKAILYSVPALALGDVIAHSLLRLK